MRLQKYLAAAGICSRRQAEKLIQQGKIFVNGQKAVLGSSVEKGDEVRYQGKIVCLKPKIYLALHKPEGYVCTTRRFAKEKNIFSLLPSDLYRANRLFPVGRLDKDSSGLLLITNDGDWAQKIIHPRYGHIKEYKVKVDKKITSADCQKLSQGIFLPEKEKKVFVKPAYLSLLSPFVLRLAIREGRNREIRKMMAALGKKVIFLQRKKIGPLDLGSLPAGKWRYLTEKEKNSLVKGKDRL